MILISDRPREPVRSSLRRWIRDPLSRSTSGRPSEGPSSRSAATAWATRVAEPRSSLISAVNHAAYSSVAFTCHANHLTPSLSSPLTLTAVTSPGNDGPPGTSGTAQGSLPSERPGWSHRADKLVLPLEGRGQYVSLSFARWRIDAFADTPMTWKNSADAPRARCRAASRPSPGSLRH